MTKLSVPDMSCGHCKASIEKALGPISDSVQVDLTKREVTVEGQPDTAKLLAALDAIGFPAEPVSL